MKWYWWLIYGYLSIAILVGLIVIIIGIRGDWDENIQTVKNGYWWFTKDALRSIVGGIIFALFWLPLIMSR